MGINQKISESLLTDKRRLVYNKRLALPPPLNLQEVWNCWGELLSYLEQENKFLDQLEQKLDDTESLQGGAEELQEALDVRPSCFSLTYKRRHRL